MKRFFVLMFCLLVTPLLAADWNPVSRPIWVKSAVSNNGRSMILEDSLLVDDGVRINGTALFGSGVTASDYVENGLFIYDTSANSSGRSFFVWRNASSGTDNQPVATFLQDYASATNYVVQIDNDGTGNALQVIQDGAANAVYIDQNGGAAYAGLHIDQGAIAGTTYTTFITRYGSNGGTNHAGQRTTTVSTSATTIITNAGRGGIYLVNGDDNTNFFVDIVIFSHNATPTVVASHTSAGSPATRTYSASSGDLQLQMGSGTYDINASSWTNNDP